VSATPATTPVPSQTPKRKEDDSPGTQTQAQPWTGVPQRDPFLVRSGGGIQGTGPRAAELLMLNAILRQSGSTLAAINNRVVTEGDSIMGFRIQSIGAERVWVEGPNGREQLVFDYGASLRVNALKSGGTLAGSMVGPEARLNWPYRVVGGVTNNAETDADWFLLSGKVLEKLANGSYLVALQAGQDPPSPLLKGQRFIVRNVPLSLVDDDLLPPVRCKYVGDESLQSRTLRAFDFGVSCAPPLMAVQSLKVQRDFLLQQYSEANDRWIKEEMGSAEQGNPSAQYTLGRRYLEGDGVPKDEQKARYWLQKSAAQGNRDSQETLKAIGPEK